MAVVFLSGNNITATSGDVKPTLVATNSVLLETDTNLTYQYNGSSWVRVDEGLKLTDSVTIDSNTAPLESWLEHGVVVPDASTGLTATADGTTTATLNYTTKGSDGVTSVAVEKAEVTIVESTVTFNDEFTSDKGWTHNTSSTSVDTTGGYMNFTDPSSTHVYAVKDLQDSDALGSGNYPSTSFVVRAEVEKTSNPANTSNGSQVQICLTDSLGSGWGNNQDQIGIFWNTDHTSSDGEFRAFGADNTNTYSSWSNATSLTWDTGTWYIEIIRNGTTDVTVKIFPDDTYSGTPTATATHSISGMTIDTLKYLQVRTFADSSRATTTYRIKNMSFHDGVTTVSNGSETVGSYSSAGSTSNTATYQVTGLTTDTDYKFKITPSNFIGAGSSTTSSTINTWKLPTVPQNLTLSQYEQSGITATWTASTAETPTPVTAITYTLERSNDGSSGWTAVSTGQSGVTFNDTGATESVAQYYRVKSQNSAGSSSYSSVQNFTWEAFTSPATIAGNTPIYNDPIMRGSPTTGGQYITDTRYQGITINTVKIWLGKNGTGGNATITCKVNGTTLGTAHTNDINGSGTYSPTEVTFTGSGITTPNSAFSIEFIMSGYSGSPPVDYTMFGYNSGDVFSGGYATQSGVETGTGKDLCMRVYFT